MSNIRIIAYSSAHQAAEAVEFLIARGVPKSEIGVLMSDRTHETHFGIQENDKSVEGTAIGGIIGGGLGAIAATAAALAGVAIPGLGFLAAGPLMAALAGLGAGAASGGIIGALTGLGFAEHEIKLYEHALKGDGVLIGISNVDENRKQLITELEGRTNPIRVARS